MITRDKAIETLVFLESNELLSDEFKNDLADIRCCIEAEKNGIHFWGGDDSEYMELNVARREDLWTAEAEQKCMDIFKAHRFTPAPYEKDEIDGLID